MRIYRHPDGTVHHSLLKWMGLSPAHYRCACIAAAEGKRRRTREISVGTVAHYIILGQRDGHRIVRYDGERRGNAWKAFQAEHPNEDIVTSKEWASAELVAQAVREHPVSGPLLTGARFEVPLAWTDAGFQCATEGVDVVGRGFIADLKFTNSAEPRKFQRHALNMSWATQMSWYDAGARANGLDTSMGHLLIAAECVPPYPVTVLALTPPLLEYGQKTYVRWLERLRVCEENDHWPEYASDILPFDLPPWLADEGVGYEGSDDSEVA